MAVFELTEDISGPGGDQPREAQALVGAFETTSQCTGIAPQDPEVLRILARGVESVPGERAVRRVAAEAGVWAAQVRAGDADPAQGGRDAEGDGAPPDLPALETVISEAVEGPGGTGEGLNAEARCGIAGATPPLRSAGGVGQLISCTRCRTTTPAAVPAPATSPKCMRNRRRAAARSTLGATHPPGRRRPGRQSRRNSADRRPSGPSPSWCTPAPGAVRSAGRTPPRTPPRTSSPPTSGKSPRRGSGSTGSP